MIELNILIQRLKELKPISGLEYSKAYTLCYDCCCSMNDGVIGGEQLYQFFKETLNNYLLEEFDDFTLEKYERFNLICKWMCKFFVYLEKSYIPHNSLPMLHNTTRNIFSECYLNINKNNLFKFVTEKIRLYRE